MSLPSFIRGPLWLASRSPRRSALLREAGLEARIRQADVEDCALHSGEVSDRAWVASLAYFKARWVADALTAEGYTEGLVLGADTLCIHGDERLGKPHNPDMAMRMLRDLRDAEHEVVTGVSLITLAAEIGHQRRWLFTDVARVAWGEVSDAELEAYVASGEWNGKAGGYNLRDRIEAGWPIECHGDPSTVMGLPLRRLEPWLACLREAVA